MPDLNDYHAFTSTTSGGGSGCSGGCLPWVLGTFAILLAIGYIFN